MYDRTTTTSTVNNCQRILFTNRIESFKLFHQFLMRLYNIQAGAPAKITDKLQSVMNAAAKIVCGLRKYEYITQHMRDTLHWLPVPQRVTYKLCLLTYKTIYSKAPKYLIELCKPVAESESRRRLRSTSTGDLLVPRTTTSFADRAFACAGPRA